MKDKYNKDVSELYLYNVGLDLLGKEKAKNIDNKAVMVAGLISCMGYEYARVKKIIAKEVKIDFKSKKIDFVNQDGSIFDTLELTVDNFANPAEWLDKLYKDNNINM
jgi:hypothetical protein